MFHPLGPDLTGLSDDELFAKINDLNSKMAQAYGSGSVLGQMHMIMAQLQNEYQNRNAKKLEAMEKNSKNFKSIINISK